MSPLVAAAVFLAAAPDAVVGLAVHPDRVALRGADAAVQLVVTATLADGRTRDMTPDAAYVAADGTALAVAPGGRITPRADGTTEVVVTAAGRTARVPVTATGAGAGGPVSFANRVMPVLTKLGCNSGACHGKQSGQNGFRLSLLGFEPNVDYATIVKDGRGRRVFPAAPEQSLLLLKATGAIPHGGGKRVAPGSDDFHLLRRWIAAGTPPPGGADPAIAGLGVFPEHRVLAPGAGQQVAVVARYADGSAEDVTRWAQFESNAPDVAGVDGGGRVRAAGPGGEAAVMARYQGQVAVTRVVVRHPGRAPDWSFPEQTVVDRFTAKKWRDLGLVPSGVCSDEQFLRRASLDITGVLPTPARVAAFGADADPGKRAKLVDDLTLSPEYADLFAARWADVLRVRRGGEPGRAAGAWRFHAWVRDAVAADMPYTQFARSIVAATGSEVVHPPAAWYKEVGTPEQFADDVAQVFLGQRMACANCHHHPYEKWSQDDYWGLAAFAGRVGRKKVPVPGADPQAGPGESIYVLPEGIVPNKRTGRPAAPTPPGATAVDVPPGDDPRQKLADWLAEPSNPYFARAVANRYWAYFFARGIVDPPDDMRVTNPPTNPELLDALAKELVDSGYSLRALVRVICKSRTYELSSAPNEWNKNDTQAYARYYPRRLPAEVLLDAVNRVTDGPPGFGGLPADRHAPGRAVQLPDDGFASYFLDVFGRPARVTACACERAAEPTLAQALHLLNGEDVQRKVTRPGGRAARLAADPRPDADKVAELFVWAFGRRPTAADLAAAVAHLGTAPGGKAAGYQDLVWAVLNTKEFGFNQ